MISSLKIFSSAMIFMPESADYPLTSITFFRFQGKNKWWAFTQMQLIYSRLARVKGISFIKYLGSGGGNGFSLIPDLSLYALLICWNCKSRADEFWDSDYYKDFLTHTQEGWTILMMATHSKGRWSGINPFHPFQVPVQSSPVIVLTRATITIRKLPEFWKDVPKVSREANNSNGMLFSKGLGEFPVYKQATFSLWSSQDAMVEYAYSRGYHPQVTQKTRTRGWYKEELFARFVPLYTTGTLYGKNPLTNVVPMLQ